jgi:phosphopantetheinyl transferase (holo-ACP synthase)
LIVGNDIVDLGDPEAHHGASKAGGCHPRFDARVFAPSELAALEASESRRLMRWILWSAKEAAYKAARQENSNVVFSPVRFIVRMSSTRQGFVSYADRRWPVRVTHQENCIQALVSGDADKRSTLWESRRLTAEELADPSRSVRQFAMAAIASRLGLSPSDIRIERSGRIPKLLFTQNGTSHALSLSHHGVYAGFAFSLGSEGNTLH